LNRHHLFSLAALLILLGPAAAQGDYYIDMDVFVATDGSVLIYGDTSLEGPVLDLGSESFPVEDGRFSNTSDRMTDKDAELWTLSVTFPPGMTEDSLITVYLPAGAKLKGNSPHYEIFSEDGDLVMTFTNRSQAEIWVNYTVGPAAPLDWDSYLVPALLIAAAVLLTAGGTRLLMPRLSRSGEKPRARGFNQDRWEAIAPTLTERERLVLESVMREGGRISQRKLRHICDLPKSTLSRVTDELQRKELLRKIPVGQTNEIRLDDRILAEGEVGSGSDN